MTTSVGNGLAALKQDILGALKASGVPLSREKVAAALPGMKPRSPELEAALEQLVRERGVFAVRISRKTHYRADDPKDAVRPGVLRVLEGEPLTAPDLVKKVLKAVPGAREEWARAALRALQAEGKVRRHPRLGTRRSDRFGVRPPDPGPYVATGVKGLRELGATLKECGVTQEAWREALARALDLPVGGVAAALSGGPPLDDEGVLLAALRRVAEREPPGALFSISRVREECSLDKPRFDAAMLTLHAARKVTLHYHDFPQSLSPERRAALVVDDQGVSYVGVALGVGQ